MLHTLRHVPTAVFVYERSAALKKVPCLGPSLVRKMAQTT